MITIDAKGMYYKELNKKIRRAVQNGEKEFLLRNVNGQRYILDSINGAVKVVIEGVPGNDLAAFMDGPTIIVRANAQDAVGNTINSGKVVVHGDAGDVLGYGMRGGKLFIKGDVGYRIGIHMKAYKGQVPLIVIGGKARDFLGEYMAGGVIVLLGLKNNNQPLLGSFCGTGMHGGVIYVRGEVDEYTLGKEVGVFNANEEDKRLLREYLKEYCEDFDLNLEKILKKKFTKLVPYSHRPYGKIYAY